MNAFITGVAGFIGSHVAKALLDESWDVAGWEVDGIDDLTTGKKENVPNAVGFSAADCREGVPQGYDCIFHAAGFSRSGAAWKNPVDCYERNVDGTLAVLEAIRGTGTRLVYASSAVVTAPTSSPYAASKAAAETLVEAYKENYGIDAASLRFSSVYGPGQSEEGQHCNVVAQMLRDRRELGKVRVAGDGRQTRDFIHIYDATRVAVDAMKGGRLWRDVCSGQQTTILGLAQMFGVPIEHVAARKGDPFEFRQDGWVGGCKSLSRGVRECLTLSP